MAHHWDSGFMVNTPSWHKLEKAVLPNSPRTWEEARKEADLLWDVDTAPVYSEAPDGPGGPFPPEYEQIEGYQVLRRDDTKAVLSVQQNSYEVVRNEKFGGVIDALLGIEGDERVEFEALMSLYGGRMVIAVCYFENPLSLSWDPSKTYTYCTFASRHDGNGGLRGIPTNVRVVCANTFNQAEAMDGRQVGFTIRHTANWEERVAELRADLVAARGDSSQWENFTEQLAMFKANDVVLDRYLKQMFPVSDAMTTRMSNNQQANRSKVRQILSSKTCEGIAENGYGLLMATSEWADHGRRSMNDSSYVGRQLLRKEEPKTRAASILREMAGIKL